MVGTTLGKLAYLTRVDSSKGRSGIGFITSGSQLEISAKTGAGDNAYAEDLR